MMNDERVVSLHIYADGRIETEVSAAPNTVDEALAHELMALSYQINDIINTFQADRRMNNDKQKEESRR